MNEPTTQTVHKTYKFKLKPTPAQEEAMAFVLRRCRELYNAGLAERREAWQKCGVSVNVASQSAQLPDIKEVRPEYRDVHSQVLQDVLTRLDRAFQAFFRRVRNRETRGYPRFQGSNRYHSFTYKQFGNGATLDNGGAGALEDWPDCLAMVAPNCGYNQNGHDQSGGGWLVRLLLVC